MTAWLWVQNIAVSTQRVADTFEDVLIERRSEFIHSVVSVSKSKYEKVTNSEGYTGIFESSCNNGIMRFSSAGQFKIQSQLILGLLITLYQQLACNSWEIMFTLEICLLCIQWMGKILGISFIMILGTISHQVWFSCYYYCWKCTLIYFTFYLVCWTIWFSKVWKKIEQKFQILNFHSNWYLNQLINLISWTFT